ncbi:MAG: hypothetical protein OEX99_00365 [Candidatus Bathyarchaeota archaeon]|nr:hypothetical protein [Candidatus Bathyarchaeota archaeon]
MSTEKHRKRLIFRWTARKGFTAIVLFSALALLIEYVLASSFMSSGLTDKTPLTTTFQFPLTQSLFTITISPLFHLTPFGVVVVLVSSWTYLTKYIAVAPRGIKPAKKPPKIQRKRLSKRVGGKFRKISRAFKSFYRRLSNAVLRVRGISYVLQRLFFARAAVKSTASIITIFLASFLALHVLSYPRSVYDAVVGLYQLSPSFLGFVLNTTEVAQGIAQVLSPIGWLASAINNALLAAAPGFKSALDNIGTSTTEPVTKLDLMGRYVLCQNLAAWVSAVTALAYGFYISHSYRRKSR